MTQLPSWAISAQKLVRNLTDAFGIHHLDPRRILAPFLASPHEGFQEPVIGWIAVFLMLLNGVALALHPPGDLLGHQLVPELPPQACRQLFGNHASAGSVLALNRNHSNHLGYLEESSVFSFQFSVKQINQAAFNDH